MNNAMSRFDNINRYDLAIAKIEAIKMCAEKLEQEIKWIRESYERTGIKVPKMRNGEMQYDDDGNAIIIDEYATKIREDDELGDDEYVKVKAYESMLGKLENMMK